MIPKGAPARASCLSCSTSGDIAATARQHSATSAPHLNSAALNLRMHHLTVAAHNAWCNPPTPSRPSALPLPALHPCPHRTLPPPSPPAVQRLPHRTLPPLPPPAVQPHHHGSLHSVDGKACGLVTMPAAGWEGLAAAGDYERCLRSGSQGIPEGWLAPVGELRLAAATRMRPAQEPGHVCCTGPWVSGPGSGDALLSACSMLTSNT